MKQLLQTCDSHLVAGLDNRAFCVANHGPNTPIVLELLAPANEKPSNGKEQKHNDASGDDNEIQAVAITTTARSKDETTKVWCAVSRRNKTLSIYCCVLSKNKDSNQKSISPSTVHKTAKRVCCLAFARVPAEKTSKDHGLDVIVAGDLIGDATAYPVQDQKSTTLKSSRLLLGHTASVLTGVKVVKGNDIGRILTSDRDEKVRVSRFPETHLIEGYLLGHTAFVASIDVAPDCNACVTCSGDGTIRLWNYKSCQQMAQTRIPDMEKADNGDGKDETESPSPLVPTAITMSPNGKHIAVIFDKCQTLFMYAASEGRLEQYQTVDCPTQPLAIRFSDKTRLFVVAKEPDYLILYQTGPNAKCFEPCRHDATCVSLSQAAAGIGMPDTLLETDKSGKAKLKLKEKDERSSLQQKKKPWTNAERIQIAKDRNARRRKRKRQEVQQQQQQQESE